MFFVFGSWRQLVYMNALDGQPWVKAGCQVVHADLSFNCLKKQHSRQNCMEIKLNLTFSASHEIASVTFMSCEI